jgi:hypothetical protein
MSIRIGRAYLPILFVDSKHAIDREGVKKLQNAALTKGMPKRPDF